MGNNTKQLGDLLVTFITEFYAVSFWVLLFVRGMMLCTFKRCEVK